MDPVEYMFTKLRLLGARVTCRQMTGSVLYEVQYKHAAYPMRRYPGGLWSIQGLAMEPEQAASMLRDYVRLYIGEEV